MSEVEYRKLPGRPGVYGIYSRTNYLIRTCTESDLMYTLDLCEKSLSSGQSLGEYGRKLEKLRASILEGLEAA